MEEKYEDEEDLRERTRNAVRGGGGYSREHSESDIFLDDLLQNANNLGLGSILMSILHHLSSIMTNDAKLNVKVDQLAIVNTFLDQIFTADDIDLGWIPLITRFLDAIRPITGQDISIDSVDDGMKHELESLRVQIDGLIQTNSALKTRLEQRTGSNQQKLNASSRGNENKLVQRLMQKEKEVTQLQAELERLNSQISNNARDAEVQARKERERARLHSLHEEVNKLQLQSSEMSDTLAAKDKEVVYLKRALESVYSRFQTRQEERASDMDAQLIASRTIENLAKRDNELTALKTEVSDLRQLLAAKSTSMSEMEFKSRNAPPPPPPQSFKSRAIFVQTPEETNTSATSNATDAPPPPPPPPPLPPPPPSSPISPWAVPSRKETPTMESKDISQTVFHSPLPPPPPPPTTPPPPPPPTIPYSRCAVWAPPPRHPPPPRSPPPPQTPHKTPQKR
jgi:hypothetical protein